MTLSMVVKASSNTRNGNKEKVRGSVASLVWSKLRRWKYPLENSFCLHLDRGRGSSITRVQGGLFTEREKDLTVGDGDALEFG
jgi:hypothetical protein